MKKQPSSFTKKLIDCLRVRSFLTSFLFVTLLCSILPQVVHAQAPPCPSSSSTSFNFEPTAEGDSITQTIDLAPCETIEVHESHDMGGDPNRGTQLGVSFLNSAQQEIVDQSISGFLTATDNLFPWLYEEPFPFTGVRDPNVLPATIKVQAIWGVAYGNTPSPPQYHFTIIRSPRPGYNIGGYDFATAPLVPSFPATYMGSLRTLDPPAPKPSDHGQFFKVHLLCGQSISVSGSATENTLYGGRFNVDLYGSNQQLVITPQPWVGVTVANYGTSYY